MTKANVEYTDTFSGEANYSWVRRSTIQTPKYDTKQPKGYQATVIRRAKKAMGISGLRGRTIEQCGMYEFRPFGMCTVMFVSWDC